MSRVILESLYYTHPHHGSIYCAGTRVSCDDGKSWITAGDITINGDEFKSVSMQNREVGQAEFFRRVADFETLGMRLNVTYVPPTGLTPSHMMPRDGDPSIARMN